MSELRELYQELILDHSKNPRHVELPEGANRRGEGFNPLCGDRIIVAARLSGDVVESIGFLGEGCAISQAAASTMTEAVEGKTTAEIEEIFGAYHRLVTGDDSDVERLGKLAAFAGVRQYPVRVKCATLAWHVLRAALAGEQREVTTE